MSACAGCGLRCRPGTDLCARCQSVWVAAGRPDEMPARKPPRDNAKAQRKPKAARSVRPVTTLEKPFRPYVWRDPKRTGKAR